MALAPKAPFSSFSTQKINSTTFVVEEHDAYGESPSIYVKLHPKAPVIIISDTGCDKPHEKYKDGQLRLRVIVSGHRPLPWHEPVSSALTHAHSLLACPLCLGPRILLTS